MKTLLQKCVRKIIPRPIRNLLRRPGTTTRQFFAEVAYLCGHVGKATLMQGMTVRCHPACQQALHAHSQDLSVIDELTQFEKTLFPGAKLLDVGCHWGVFSLVALQRGGAASSVLAVDASHSAVKMSKINLRLNGGLERATIIHAAIGANEGQLEMLTSGPSGLGFYVVPADPRPDTISIRQTTLTKLCSDHDFKPSHLKIDIEGFEEEALVGAKTLLMDARPILFLELHGDLIRQRHRNPVDVLKLLREAGYSHWQLAGKSVDEQILAEHDFNVRLVCWPK
jgi:FkbM family methyltransferase